MKETISKNEIPSLRFEDGIFKFTATLNESPRLYDFSFNINIMNNRIEYDYSTSMHDSMKNLFFIDIYTDQYEKENVYPYTFNLDFEIDFEIKFREVIERITSDIQELKLTPEHHDEFVKLLKQWYNKNFRMFNRHSVKRLDGSKLITNIPNSLECYEKIKETLKNESGVTDSDSTSVKVMKITRHISMVDMWKKYEKDALQLDNNDLIVNMFGKYLPNIVFVLKNEYKSYLYEFGIMPNDIEKTLNVHWDGSPSIMYGKYWISKKGSKCFTPTSRELATHMLIENTWGGCFEHSRGHEYENVSGISEYSRYTRSNGGGCGYCYYILKTETSNVITIDDI